jgi:hypothetical protein
VIPSGGADARADRFGRHAAALRQYLPPNGQPLLASPRPKPPEEDMKKIVAFTALITVLAFAGVALAEGTTVRVSGIEAPNSTAPSDPCYELDPATGQPPVIANAMAGSLIGCWFTDAFTWGPTSPSGILHATGAEHFVGCLDIKQEGRCAEGDPAGTLALSARFEFKVVNNQEIWGRCQHQILSGTGDFVGATGEIDFKDSVPNGTSSYRGRITLAERHDVVRPRAAVATAAAHRLSSVC